MTGVTASPGSSTVTALNNVTFMCIPSSPHVIPDGYSWHRVDGDIPSHSSGQNTDTLTIHRIVPADEGEYYCMAAQYGHCAVSNNAMVIVESKKIILHNHSKQLCSSQVCFIGQVDIYVIIRL